MSKCISTHGEFSEHELDDEYVCKLCSVLDEGALRLELAFLRGLSRNEGYQEKARRLVFEYIKPRLEKTDKHVTFAVDEVYVVWFCKTLQNWKALISTTLPDGMYYEVTYNGDQHETYIDAYKKFDNVLIKDPDVGVHIPMVDSD